MAEIQKLEMASTAEKQGRYDEALEAYEDALRIQRAKLGDDHPDVAATRNNLGLVYYSQGRHAEAPFGMAIRDLCMLLLFSQLDCHNSLTA